MMNFIMDDLLERDWSLFLRNMTEISTFSRNFTDFILVLLTLTDNYSSPGTT